MPVVSEATVRFLRKIQVRDYEPAECEVTLKAALLEGEQAGSVVNDLLKTASGEVHEALGLRRDTQVPLTATRAVGEKVVRDQFGAVQSKEQVSAPVTAAADPKAAAKAAKKAAAAATPPSTAAAAEIPDSAAVPATAAATAAPAAQTAPANDPTAIPDASAVPAAAPAAATPATVAAVPATPPAQAPAASGDTGLTPAALSSWVGEQVRNGKITVAAVATVYPQFGVRRLTDLKADQVAGAKAAIEAKIAEHSASEGL